VSNTPPFSQKTKLHSAPGFGLYAQNNSRENSKKLRVAVRATLRRAVRPSNVCAGVRVELSARDAAFAPLAFTLAAPDSAAINAKIGVEKF